MRNKLLRVFFLLFFSLIFFSFASLFFGSEKILPKNLNLIFNPDSLESIIILQLRLPRILLCIFCGFLLGGTGAVLQGFFRNPLADSGILGISSGASLGAILCGFFSFYTFKFIAPITIFAFLGGLATGLLIFSFSFLFKKSSGTSLLLAGTAVGTFISAVSSLILLIRQKDLHSIFAWTMGSFNGKSWDDLGFFIFPSILAIFLLIFSAPYLDILGSGEKTALSLGLDYKYVKIFVLITTSLSSSCAVCMGGIISFIGLISPHIVRSFSCTRHRILIPLSMLTGAIILVISDSLARCLIAPGEIPVGIITSIIGVPFFIYVLRKNQNV